MEISEKLKILSDSAKYDVSCSSSGTNRKSKKGIGSTSNSGICHSFTPDGRCISLLKILMSNSCIYDCVYCVNRKSNDCLRATFTPEEVAQLTINFYRRNYIEGLFLSSGIVKSPNFTMERLYTVAYLLRNTYNFNGYIHMKAIPGSDTELIEKTGMLVDRMSINIELPSENSLKLLAPDKNKQNILTPMRFISGSIKDNLDSRKKYKASPKFVPGGQSTQLIVGASNESDKKIIKLSESLYNSIGLKRVYYSAYVPVTRNELLPNISSPPRIRENRLYQADWLLRFYGFKASELLDEKSPNFDLNFDPKTNWALKNLHKFPVEINTAEYEILLRVPGIGVRSSMKILSARRVNILNFDNLKKLGIVIKRAKYFITCSGKYYGDTKFDKPFIERVLSPSQDLNAVEEMSLKQISMFNLNVDTLSNRTSSIVGEI